MHFDKEYFLIVDLLDLCIYEGHLDSSLHGIITLQCVDELQSNDTFSETRTQQLLDGLIFIKK